MMYNQKKSTVNRLRGLALVPALGVALAVTNINAVASVISETASADFVPNKVSEISVNQQAPTQEDSDTQNAVSSPEFPGGADAMSQFICDNINYPKEAEDAGISGQVIVQFTVETDGSISNIQVLRSCHELLDAEAVRVVKLMPKFTPGMIAGKPVATHFAIPFQFAKPDLTIKKTNAGATSAKKSIPDDAEIYVDGERVTKEQFEALTPNQIRSVEINKAGNQTKILVTLKSDATD